MTTHHLAVRNHVIRLFLNAVPQDLKDHAALKALKDPVVNAALQGPAVIAVPKDPVALKDPAVNAVPKGPVVNAVNAARKAHAVNADQEVRAVSAEPPGSAAPWVDQAKLDLLVRKVLPEYLALPELLASKALKALPARPVQ
jgi:hypothetical protein